jgi:hypothetical protein
MPWRRSIMGTTIPADRQYDGVAEVTRAALTELHICYSPSKYQKRLSLLSKYLKGLSGNLLWQQVPLLERAGPCISRG